MRKGIIAAGNWVSDTVKFIRTYPTPGNLVTIERIEQGFGGCAHNVLADLAHLESGIPLYAGGCVGRDAWGDEIMAAIERMGIDAEGMAGIGFPLPLGSDKFCGFRTNAADAVDFSGCIVKVITKQAVKGFGYHTKFGETIVIQDITDLNIHIHIVVFHQFIIEVIELNGTTCLGNLIAVYPEAISHNCLTFCINPIPGGRILEGGTYHQRPGGSAGCVIVLSCVKGRRANQAFRLLSQV